MNNFRNEHTIKLNNEEILLRPTFENVASTESKLGSLTYLAWKFSRSTRTDLSLEEKVRVMPTLTDCAQIIYHNQAATDPQDPTKKKYSLTDIWEKVQANGIHGVVNEITVFLAKMTAGNEKVDEIENKKKEIEEKKS